MILYLKQVPNILTYDIINVMSNLLNSEYTSMKIDLART